MLCPGKEREEEGRGRVETGGREGRGEGRGQKRKRRRGRRTREERIGERSCGMGENRRGVKEMGKERRGGE